MEKLKLVKMTQILTLTLRLQSCRTLILGAARPGIMGEMARNKFLMSRKNLKNVKMLKDFDKIK